MTNRLPSLNALRAFETVSRHGSIVQAAEELHVTAGAVSRMIKTLEAELGMRLLARDGRGVTLTGPAQEAAPKLQAAFQQMQTAMHQLRHGNLERALSVGVEPVFASGWLVSRLDGFHRIAPSIDIRIDATQAEPDARRGETDIAIYYGTADQNDLDAVKLEKEEIFAVCSPTALQQNGPINTLDDLSRHTLLHYADAPESWQWPSWKQWLATLGVTGVDSSRGLRMVAGQAIMEAARGGQGVALAVASIARDDMTSGRLVRVHEAGIPAPAGYVLATKPGDRDRADIAAFRDWLLAAIQKP